MVTSNGAAAEPRVADQRSARKLRRADQRSIPQSTRVASFTRLLGGPPLPLELAPLDPASLMLPPGSGGRRWDRRQCWRKSPMLRYQRSPQAEALGRTDTTRPRYCQCAPRGHGAHQRIREESRPGLVAFGDPPNGAAPEPRVAAASFLASVPGDGMGGRRAAPPRGKNRFPLQPAPTLATALGCAVGRPSPLHSRTTEQPDTSSRLGPS